MEIDIRAEHGVGLDAGAMEAVVRKRTARAGREQRRAAAEARRRGKLSGARLGWWSLLGE